MSARKTFILANPVMRILLTLCLLLAAGTVHAIERVTYYHNDALGSPVAATDASGTLLWRESYAPYGERLTHEASSKDTVWYTGKQEEAAFGLNYFGARWYDPQIGRFMGVDPAGFSADNIQSFNRYAYANNNPYAYVDPDGRENVGPGEFFGIGGGGSGGGGGLSGEFGGARGAFGNLFGTVPRSGLGATGKNAAKSTVQANEVPKGIPSPDGGFAADLTKSAAKSRSGHRNAANNQLNDAMARDPQLRDDIEKRFGTDAFDRTSTSGGGRRNPAGAEWDHNSSNPNQLDLRTSGNHRQKTSAEGQQGGGWKRFHGE